MREELSMEEFVMVEENFHGSWIFLALKRKLKNQYEKVFSTESKEQH